MSLGTFVLGCCAGSALAFLVARRRPRPVESLAATPPRSEPEPAPSIGDPRGAARSIAKSPAEVLRLAGLVHELRTPLAAIRAYAELLSHPNPDREFLEEASAILVAESERLDGLIGAHLDLVRSAHVASSAGLRREAPVCELGGEARAVRELMRPLAQRCGIAIELDAGSPPVEARGEHSLVRQILANLLGNALKHAVGGQLVRLRWRRVAEEAILEVEDDGPGLAACDATQLFEPFANAQAKAGAKGGHGLGLWIAREFARSCGGELEAPARGPEARGALFRLRLPLATSPSRRATLVA